MVIPRSFRVRAAHAFTAGCLFIAGGFFSAQGQTDVTTPVPATYSASVSEGSVPAAPEVDLPDVDKYTVESLKAKLPEAFNGQAAVGPTLGEACLSESFKDKRSKDFQSMQGTPDTQVIKLKGGALTLSQIVKQINDPKVIETVGDETILRLPLLVTKGATLVIQGADTPIVRLATKSGTLLANAGTLFVIDATVSSWDEASGVPTPFVDAEQFRPFVTSFAGSATYVGGSTFQQLGYGSPSAYGFSLTSHPNRNTEEGGGNWPTGALVENTFEGLLYGFYSFEACDVAIVNNRYVGNIRYGIDPHDRSTRLIIARNVAEGTVERHGIIGSRGISDSYIFDNVSRNNAKSGIMLDRQCTGNVIANNRVFDNGNGIALYESPNNLVLNNMIVFNGGTGLRARNSTDVLVQGNIIVGNQGFAISCESRHLTDHQKRLERGDTYEMTAGLNVYSNMIAGNGDGMFKGSGVKYLRVADVKREVDLKELAAATGGTKRQLPIADSDPLGGDLEGYEIEFQAMSRSPEKVLEITRTN